jgi:beta-glucanase (GH16 family)
MLSCVAIAWLVYQASGDADQRAARTDRPVWQDNFTGPAGARPDPTKWRILSGPREDHLQYYTHRPSNVSLDGAGHLALTAHREKYTDADGLKRSYTSGTVETQGLFSTKYGRLEARIKIPRGQGLWPGFWAVGNDDNKVKWPRSGEIDMFENLGDDPSMIYGSIHGPQRGGDGEYAITNAKRSAVSLEGAFHIYGVTWRRRKIVFELDRVPYATVTPASLSAGQRWVFEKPFFMILNLAVGGWAGPPDATTRFGATLLVDWVRAHR